MNNEGTMSFLNHIAELRKRLIYSIIAISVLFVPSYFFSQQLFDFLMTPVRENLAENSFMIFTSPAEGFMTYLKVSIFTSFVLAFPFVLYQLWSFISPALYKHEKKIVIPFILFGTLFFIIGASFCYYIAAPQCLRFLLGDYSSQYVKALPSISAALSFLMTLTAGFGIVFEFPIIIFVLSRFGLVTTSWLKEKRKYAIFIFALLAAAITPPDVISMMVMFVPLIIFYEIGIVVAAIFGKKRVVEKNEDNEEE